MGTMAPQAWPHPQGGVNAKPWIVASATSIILSNGEGEEGEGAKGAD
jgi:hypothetical protein